MHVADDDVAGYWDDFAETWSEKTGEGGDFSHRKFIIPSMLRLLGDVKGECVLDLACGTGIFTRHLARAGARVVGVELSGKMLDKARGFEEKEPLGIVYHQGNACRLDRFEDASFDAVTCNMAFMDMADFEGALSEAHRVLLLGGRLVFSILHPCFFTPGSGWEKTDPTSTRNEDKLYWKVDHYFERQSGRGMFGWSRWVYFHRTLGDYLNAVIRTGFVLTEIDEPEPPVEVLAEAECLDETRKASFLVIKATEFGDRAL